VSDAGSELDLVYSEKYAEGGDLQGSIDLPPVEREVPSLRHEKGGLLSIETGSPSFGSSRFQLTLAPTPEFDGKQIVFGQLLASLPSASQLHALQWVQAVGAASGTPWEAVVVETCGECQASETEALLGAMVMAAQVDRTCETQEDRYGRTGISHGSLENAITNDNVSEVITLTDDWLHHLEYAAKKAKTASEKDRKAREIESSLKGLKAALKKVEFKVGEVSGFDNKEANSRPLLRNAKAQLIRVKDLEESMVRLY